MGGAVCRPEKQSSQVKASGQGAPTGPRASRARHPLTYVTVLKDGNTHARYGGYLYDVLEDVVL